MMRLNELEFAVLYEAQEPAPVNVSEFTAGDFIGMLLDGARIVDYWSERATEAVDFVRNVKGTIKGIEAILKAVKSWEVEQTEEEQRAAFGVQLPSLAETILLDLVQAYHLHSTEEAERLPVADWLLVRKARAAEAKFSRNYNVIVSKKNKNERPTR